MNYSSPFGDPCGRARLKSVPEDFRVTELPSYTPCGEGEHLWLWIKKTDANTAWVAEQLAQQTGLRLRDVSYAGRKDKQAVTEQWFSLYDPKRTADAVHFDIKDCEIQKAIRHTQKLRVGNLLGNKFEIRLRDFEGDKNAINERLATIQTLGFPNYFGVQRFGRKFSNIKKAKSWVDAGGGRLGREQRSVYLSTLRSYLFNQVLARRVQDKTWNRILNGELVQLMDTHSLFVANKNDPAQNDIQTRCETFDLDPTGPLYGKEKMHPEAEAQTIESSVLGEYPDLKLFLAKETSAARRRLRVHAKDLNLTFEGNDLRLSFSLGAGVYATVLLDQLIQTLV